MGPNLGPAAAAPPQRVLRATSGTIAMIVSGVVAIVLLGDAVIRAGFLEMLRLSPWVLLALWCVYVLMYAPHIAFDRRGATVQNYLRRTSVPWSAVRDVRMRWQIVFDLSDGAQLKAYGGPVAGRPGRAERKSDAGPRANVPQSLRELGWLRDAWIEAEPDAADAAVRRSWDVPALAALAVILVGAVSAVLTLPS